MSADGLMSGERRTDRSPTLVGDTQINPAINEVLIEYGASLEAPDEDQLPETFSVNSLQRA